MFAALLVALLWQPPAEVLAAVRVQGNLSISDEEVVRMAGVSVGSPIGPDVEETVAARLRATKRFERVEVRKRFASIDDPSQIALVIVVDEGPVSIQMTGDPNQPTRVVRSRRLNLLFAPILGAEDGYGVTYGARLAVANPLGARSQLAFPLTWGGTKRAGIEYDKSFDRGVVTHVQAGASITRRTHPFFREDEDRDRVWIRGEREIVESLRVGATGGWQRVSFFGNADRFTQFGADVTFDTRADPMLPRNAVYARAAWEHSNFRNDTALSQWDLDVRGYLGVIGQTVVVVRAQREDADQTVPAYLQPILGGLRNLRGFAAGTAVGDTLVASSVEVRAPLTSPLSVGKIGVSGFVDAGAAYAKGARLTDQTIRKGYGGSVWFSAAFLRLEVAVAHGVGSSTRVHVGGGVTF